MKNFNILAVGRGFFLLAVLLALSEVGGAATDPRELGRAACKGNLSNMSKILDENPGIDVDAKDEFGRTALMLAAECGEKNMVQFLIGKRADVNAKDAESKTLLIYGVQGENIDVVSIFINKGLDLNAKDEAGHTALMWAVHLLNGPISKLLIEKRADVNARAKDGASALIDAVRLGSFECARILIENGKADVSFEDQEGKTALWYALDLKFDKIAELLRLNGAVISWSR